MKTQQVHVCMPGESWPHTEPEHVLKPPHMEPRPLHLLGKLFTTALIGTLVPALVKFSVMFIVMIPYEFLASCIYPPTY